MLMVFKIKYLKFKKQVIQMKLYKKRKFSKNQQFKYLKIIRFHF